MEADSTTETDSSLLQIVGSDYYPLAMPEEGVAGCYCVELCLASSPDDVKVSRPDACRSCCR